MTETMGRKVSYSQQSSRNFSLSRSVQEHFPDSRSIKRRGVSIQLSGQSSSSSSVFPSLPVSEAGVKTRCVQWKHVVSGGRIGNKHRKRDNTIDFGKSYIDIVEST